MIVDVQSPQFGLGELLGATFRLLKVQFVPLLKAFLPLLGLVILVAGLFAAGVYGAIHYTGFYNPQKWDSLPMMIQVVGIVVTVTVLLVVGSIIQVSVMQVTADSCAGQSLPSTTMILRRAWSRVPALWGTLLVMGLYALVLTSPFVVLIVVAGALHIQSNTLSVATFFLMLVEMPLIYAAAVYVSFTMEEVALRAHSGGTAIRHSFSLVRGQFWRTLGYIIVIFFVGWAIAIIPMIIIQTMSAVAALPSVQSIGPIFIAAMVIMVGCMLMLQLLFHIFFYIAHTIMFLKWESSKLPGPELIEEE